MVEETNNPFYAGPEHQPFALGYGVPGALLIHGFMGTPAELRPLGEKLAENGWTTHAPLLPGFGPDVPNLGDTTYEAWLDASRSQWQALHKFHQPTVLVGFSMGGSIALHLAAEFRPDALVLIAPFTRFAMRAANWLMPLLPIFRPNLNPFADANFDDPATRAQLAAIIPGVDLGDPEVQAQLRREAKLPTRSLEQLRQLGREAVKLAAEVTCPTLIIQGRRDETVLHGDTRALLTEMGGPVTYQELDEGHEIMRLDRVLDIVADYVAPFREGAPRQNERQAAPV